MCGLFFRLSKILISSQRPGNVVHTQGTRKLLNEFLQDRNVTRVTTFQSSKFLETVFNV